MMQFLRQVQLLSSRNLCVLLGDKLSAGWAFAQVPLMAILIVICFHGSRWDDPALDYFSRFTRSAQQYVTEKEESGDSVVIGKGTARSLYAASERDTQIIGVGTAQRRGAVYYLLVSAAIWFGLMGACKEVVGERHVLLRESRTCYGHGAYLTSKLLVQACIIGTQTALLGLLTLPFLLDLPWKTTILMTLVLWGVGIAAAVLGLLVSSSCSSIRMALTWVPILMVPQFLFGGLLRPLAMASNETPPPLINPSANVRPVDRMKNPRDVLSCLVIQRWGFDALLSLDERYATGGVFSLRFNWPDTGPDSPSWRATTLMNVVHCRESTLADTILPRTTAIDRLVGLSADQADCISAAGRTRRALIALSAWMALTLAGTLAVIKTRFR